jgi:hypothetical protein
MSELRHTISGKAVLLPSVVLGVAHLTGALVFAINVSKNVFIEQVFLSVHFTILTVFGDSLAFEE